MPGWLSMKNLPWIAAGLAAVAVLIGGVFWWMGKQKWEVTDNAFVQADTVQVSPQVAGYVAEVLVGDNQRVEAGQVLVRLDPSTFEARVEQAQANLLAFGSLHILQDAEADFHAGRCIADVESIGGIGAGLAGRFDETGGAAFRLRNRKHDRPLMSCARKSKS